MVNNFGLFGAAFGRFGGPVKVSPGGSGGTVSLAAVAAANWDTAYSQSSAITNGSGTYGAITGVPVGMTANVVGSDLVFAGTPN